jgi:hypothetical protein
MGRLWKRGTQNSWGFGKLRNVGEKKDFTESKPPFFTTAEILRFA